MEVINTLKTLHIYNTPHSADSVEWCPHAPFQDTFVCATYELSEENQQNAKKRLGCILLFSVKNEKGLVHHQTVNTAAVLDQKWCPNQINGSSILGVVNAEKTIEIYKLNTGNCIIELVTSIQINEEGEILLLSLDWSNGKYSSQEPHLICSDSKGSWHHFLYSNNNLTLISTSHCHEYEAWIAAYYYWDNNIFFTGGDDSMLLKFDLKVGTQPILKNKSHEAGVTSIHSNSEKEFVLVTGSYDEVLRLWDIRNMKNPSSSLRMSGPIWRVKWDPLSHQYVLAACMLGGAHIIKESKGDQLEIIASYNEHKSITYGADWCHLPDGSLKQFGCDRIIGTCSFYDKLLCVTKFVI